MSKSLSRAARLDIAKNMASEAKCRMEELRDELQNWLDNLPENLQNGSKAEALQTAIDGLEEAINGLEDAENTDVEFPGMFG